MLKISNINKQQLDKKLEKLRSIPVYKHKWSSVLSMLCDCSIDLVKLVFKGERIDYKGIEKKADYLIECGENIPKKVATYLERNSYGKLRRK